MSLKRKWEEVGEHIVSAALGDMVSRAIATVVDKLEGRAEADGEVERLDTLVTMVRSATDAAEGVHIRSWWLRRWLSKLRDAACEGAAAVRSHRLRRAAEEEEEEEESRARAAGGRPWWRWGGSVVRLLIRSATSVLFRDGGATTLRREVARMEEAAAGPGEFLKLLDIEIRRQEGSSDRRLLLMDAEEERDAHQIRQPSQLPRGTVRVRRIIRVALWEGGGEEGDENGEDIELFLEDCVYLAAVINEDDEVAKQSRSKNMEGRIRVVMWLALGATVIWFALQDESQMFRRGRPAHPSPVQSVLAGAAAAVRSASGVVRSKNRSRRSVHRRLPAAAAAAVKTTQGLAVVS